MRLSSRLAIAMVALVLVTVLTLGVLAYHNLQRSAVPLAIERMLAHTRLAATMLEARLEYMRERVTTIQLSAPLRNLMRASLQDGHSDVPLTTPQARARLASVFLSELTGHPATAMIRLFDADGNERVRVDRLGPNGAIRTVAENTLGLRGDREYFRRTAAQPPEEIYISPVTLSGAPDLPNEPRTPSLRAGLPLHDEAGKLIGAVIIDLDLRPSIAWLRANLTPDRHAYVVNAAGDFLFHPDAAREFGFERGWPDRIQDEFPALREALFDRPSGALVAADAQQQLSALAWHWVKLAGGPNVAVVEAIPYGQLTRAGVALRGTTLAAAAAVLAAILVAVLLARSLTRPLVRITRAVEDFSRGDIPPPITGGSQEIATLAATFSRMALEARARESALKDEVATRRRLAELLDSTLRNMPDPVMIIGIDRKPILVNPAAQKLIGDVDDVEPLIAERGMRRYYADGVTRIPRRMSPILRVLEGRSVENFEVVVEGLANRKRSHFVINGRPIRNEAGEVQAAVMAYRDVTRKMRALQRVQDSERMARAIVDTALDAFVQVGPDGVILEWSPKAAALFGWSREQAVGSELSALLFTPQQLPGVLDSYRRFLDSLEQGSDGYRIEAEAVRSDGTPLHVEVAMTALKRDAGYILNAFIRDVTERVVAEERLRQAQKMEAIGQLTGGIAHDFNNMLTVITGTIDLLAASVADKPEAASIARLIGDAADRGAELIRHLLTFARKQPLDPGPADLRAVIEDVQNLLKPTLGADIAITWTSDPDLWPVFVDRAQLEAALVNLAVNARDAMPGGGALRIETRNVALDADKAHSLGGLAPGPYVSIAVEDTGSGIPEEIQPRVFEPFFTTKGVGQGTGLGLSMTYGFVRQSGGHITLRSAVGMGTTFTLYLPQAKAALEDAAAEDDGEIPRGTETILVVEDDAMVRGFVIAQLESLGYRTLSAWTGAAAMDVCRSEAAFDLLFTDIRMPGEIGGFDLAMAAAAQRPALRVLFTSGYSADAARLPQGILQNGLLLAKPYRRGDLARMIRLALDSPFPPAEPLSATG